MNYQNVTRIDDLPDLEDLDTALVRNTSFDKEQDEREFASSKYKKFIRTSNSKNLSPGSGMITNYNNGSYPMGRFEHQPDSYGGIASNSQMFYEPYEMAQLSCVNVADHALSCPVCSRLYNNDRTVYIIAIVILIIICILLLKRILEL